MALGFISVEFPEFVGATVKIPDHAWFFRFGIRGGIGRTRLKNRTTGRGYIYIRRVTKISTIVRKDARMCASSPAVSPASSRLRDWLAVTSGSGTSLPPDLDPVTVQNNRLEVRSEGQLEVTPSACETTDCASSLTSWSADTDRSELATLLVRGPRISTMCVSAPPTSSLRAVITATVIPKREKHTGTWHGLGDSLSLQIDVRAHNVRISGNRQNARTINLVSNVDSGHGTAVRPRGGVWE